MKNRFCYVVNQNSHGDTQGILFQLDRSWSSIKKESLDTMSQYDFANLVKKVADLRGITVKGLPIEIKDIETAIDEMNIPTSNSNNSRYKEIDNGRLVHEQTQIEYIQGYACSCILKANPDAQRKPRVFRTPITAAKSVVRSLLPMGYWKTAKLVDARIEYDDSALRSCVGDFLGSGKHHLVNGVIPTEVFQMARKIQQEAENDML